MLITGSNNIEMHRLCVLKSALKLEILGMKRSRNQRSAYSLIKAEFGFNGNKKNVFNQLEEYIHKQRNNK